MPLKKLRVKTPPKTKDIFNELMTTLEKGRPTKEGAGTYSVSLSTSSFTNQVTYFLKTGISSIDVATGGFPFGRIIEVFGPEGSGKTALAWQLCHQAMNL